MPAKRARSVLILLAMAFLLSSGLRPQTRPSEALDETLRRLEAATPSYAKGLAAFRAGELVKAEAAFRTCLDRFPGHAYAHYYAANIRYIRKDYAAALASMESALARFDEMTELGAKIEARKAGQRDALRMTLDDLADSIISCRDSRSIEWERDAVDVEEFASEKAASGRTDALTRLKAHYVYFRGNVLFQLKRVPEAFRCYEEAVRLDPRHADAINNLIAILFVAREYPAAQAILEKAEAAGLDESLNLALKSQLFLALGRPVEGILYEDLEAGRGTARLSIRRFALAFRPAPDAGKVLYVNAYVVFDPSAREAVLIDPGARDARIGDFVREKGLRVRAVLVTHAHPDHAAASRFYASEFGAPVCAPRAEARSFESPPDRLLKDGDGLPFGGLAIRAVEIPGHTAGGLCFLVDGAAFCGDTLLRNDIGAVAESDATKRDRTRRTMIQAIRGKLLTLPDDTLVCPGHGRTTTVGAEKASNTRLAK